MLLRGQEMSDLLKGAIVGVLTALTGLIVSFLSSGYDLEERFGLAVWFHLRGPRNPLSDVLVVSLDTDLDTSLNLPKDPRKWPRSLHAQLVGKLFEEGAAVIVFDLIFNESRCVENDEVFADAIRRAGNVVLYEDIQKIRIIKDASGIKPTQLNIEKLLPPIRPLADAAIAYAPFPLPKRPNRVSRYWTFKTGAGDKPTLPVIAFQFYALNLHAELVRRIENEIPLQLEKITSITDLKTSWESVERLTTVFRSIFHTYPHLAPKLLNDLERSKTPAYGFKNIRMLQSLVRLYAGDDNRYLNFYGPPRTISTISYSQALQGRKSFPGNKRPLAFKDKAIFIGLSEPFQPDQKDSFHTVFSQPDGIDLCGVEIAATAFLNLLEDLPVQPLPLREQFTIVLLWGLGLGFICRFLRTIISSVMVLSIVLFYLVVALHKFTSAGSWYPLIIPVCYQAPLAFLVSLLWKHHDAKQNRRIIKKAFEYYVPRQVVEQLSKNLGDVKNSNQLISGACLFTDAQHFTTLSENMEPMELGRLMNLYFKHLAEPITLYKGMVLRFIGDAILAVWTSPHSSLDHRSNSCLAALDVAKAVHQFNRFPDTPRLPTRIGLHAGPMFIGSIGSTDHYDYTPMGDVVNTASRIEGLNKQLGTRILVSDAVLDQVDGMLERKIGEFLLVGKSKPIIIHELISRLEEASEGDRYLCAHFSRALAAFKEQAFEDAIELFAACMEYRPGDGPSHFYTRYCHLYNKIDLEANWNGLIRLKVKK